jgi:uncharacterized coiled-coil protein SlyX
MGNSVWVSCDQSGRPLWCAIDLDAGRLADPNGSEYAPKSEVALLECSLAFERATVAELKLELAKRERELEECKSRLMHTEADFEQYVAYVAYVKSVAEV